MGRIKSTMIKKAARQLLQHDLHLNSEFENDKKILGDTMPSKKMRNKIAGYIARLLKAKQEQQSKEKTA